MVIAIQLYHKRGGANYRVWLFYERIFWLQPLWASFNLISFTYLLEIAPIIYVQGTIGSQTQIWLVYSMKLWGEFCEKTFMQLSESLLYLPVIEVSFFVCFNEVWKWRVDPTACHSTGPHQPLPIKDGQIIFLETHLPFYFTTNEYFSFIFLPRLFSTFWWLIHHCP